MTTTAASPSHAAVDRLRAVFKQIRVHQWVKNLLIFIPLIAAHHFDDTWSWIALFQAFCAFSFTASTIYIINDLCDLRSDRLDPIKCKRPFASGALPTNWAPFLMAGLLTAAVISSWNLPIRFREGLLLYVAINLLYSFRLKRIIIVDVVILASLYTLRILMGGYAANIPISRWLLAFSIFVFFSLALVKRYTEILHKDIKSENTRRGYLKQDKDVLLALGASSSFLSMLIFVLYINSPEITQLYALPGQLWFVIPVMLYWFSRLWILSSRGVLSGDPVVFILRDPSAWLTLGVIAIIAGMGMGLIPAF